MTVCLHIGKLVLMPRIAETVVGDQHLAADGGATTEASAHGYALFALGEFLGESTV
jgi:hypothetical protein